MDCTMEFIIIKGPFGKIKSKSIPTIFFEILFCGFFSAVPWKRFLPYGLFGFVPQWSDLDDVFPFDIPCKTTKNGTLKSPRIAELFGFVEGVFFYGFYHYEYPSNHHLGEYVLVFPSIEQATSSCVNGHAAVYSLYLYVHTTVRSPNPRIKEEDSVPPCYKFKPPRSWLIRLKFQQQCSSLWVPKKCFVCLGRWIFCWHSRWWNFTCSPRSRRGWSNVMSWNHQLPWHFHIIGDGKINPIVGVYRAPL